MYLTCLVFWNMRIYWLFKRILVHVPFPLPFWSHPAIYLKKKHQNDIEIILKWNCGQDKFDKSAQRYLFNGSPFSLRRRFVVASQVLYSSFCNNTQVHVAAWTQVTEYPCSNSILYKLLCFFQLKERQQEEKNRMFFRQLIRRDRDRRGQDWAST